MPICSHCGSNIADPIARVCPNCGAPLTAASSPHPAASYNSPPPPAPRAGRPAGIAVLAILQVIGSLFFLLAGALFLVIGGLLLAALGGFLLIIGFIGFVVAWGLWTGKGWAWTVGLVLAIISIVLNLIGIARGAYTDIIGVLIPLLIVYYLTRAHVKAFFGK